MTPENIPTNKRTATSVFKTLISENIPFAVLVAYRRAKGVISAHSNEYIVLGSYKKDCKFLRSMGFVQTDLGHELVMERGLNDAEVSEFKALITEKKFRLAQNDEDGRIYEYHTVNNFVTYCGGKLVRPKKGPKPLAEAVPPAEPKQVPAISMTMNRKRRMSR